MMGRNGRWTVLAAVVGLVLSACGGATDPPPAPPPPPPPPPPPGGSVPPAISLDMTVGEIVTLTNPAQVRSFQLDGGGEARDYQMIVQSASESFGGVTPMQIRVTAAGASANAVPVRIPVLERRSGPTDRELAMRASSAEMETVLRDRTRQEMARVGAAPFRPGFDVSASVAAGRPPVLGEMLTFSIGIDSNFNPDCNNTGTIMGEVVYAGQNFTVVEDVDVAGTLTPSDYQEIGTQLDNVVYPTNVAYFGPPADIDNNQTVIALITAEVNRFTPQGSNAIIAGFFFAGDLLTKAGCPASNEGEIFYLIGPDPGAQFGPAISAEFANTLARTTVAHEFLHLINTEQRAIIGNGDLITNREDAWLDEGLAHLAEELAGLATAGLGTRSNLDLNRLTLSQADLDAFNDFHLLNVDRFASFLYDGPESVMTLGTSSGGDPGGVESLTFRGFGYGFVRWLGDHFGPAGAGTLPGSREELLFRELSRGGPSHVSGITNVEAALQAIAGSNLQWDELLSLYLASLVADDNAPSGTDPRAQSLTWDLRGLYAQLQTSNLGMSNPFDRPYPLVPAAVTLTASTNQVLTFSTNASSGRYVSITSPATSPDVVIQVTNQSGADLAGGVAGQVTILRTR